MGLRQLNSEHRPSGSWLRSTIFAFLSPPTPLAIFRYTHHPQPPKGPQVPDKFPPPSLSPPTSKRTHIYSAAWRPYCLMTCKYLCHFCNCTCPAQLRARLALSHQNIIKIGHMPVDHRPCSRLPEMSVSRNRMAVSFTMVWTCPSSLLFRGGRWGAQLPVLIHQPRLPSLTRPAMRQTPSACVLAACRVLLG